MSGYFSAIGVQESLRGELSKFASGIIHNSQEKQLVGSCATDLHCNLT
jgi:hypothetical protein